MKRQCAMRGWLIGIAIILLAQAAAASGADGGIRSVFAYGAGSRAQAMGGAYAARADDASALFWNPGALGLLTRSEFQAGHTSLYGLGFNEQYASYIHPSWRYGVFAVGFRHFGVGGIEERDERNVLLSDDLSSSEHQLSLAFGRTFNDVWSLGGSVKLRRQELAGLAGSGLGIDFGVLTRPALVMGWRNQRLRSFSIGLALSNLVEPSLRLDQESLKDPGAIRLGFSYEYLLHARGIPYPLWFVPVLDFEKVGGMSTRVHSGLEINNQLLAFRLGYGGGNFTAGSGVNWRDFNFDYVFEGNALENIHRFSVTYRHGRTIHESRQAALRSQDEALQTRLAAAFQERQNAQVAELLQRADEIRAHGDYDGALEVLATLEALAPDNERVAGMIATCLGEKASTLEETGDYAAAVVTFHRALTHNPDDPVLQAGLERCQTESDERAARSEELRKRFASGLDAFSADRLVEARDAFHSILKERPGDEEAASMLARTQRAIASRTASIIDQAGRFTRRGFLKEAGELLDQAEKLDAKASGLEQARVEFAAAERAWTGRAREASKAADESEVESASSTAAEKTTPALSRKKLAEIEHLYQRGNAAAESGRNDDALRYWELVWSAYPGYKQVDEHLKREYLTRGMEIFAAGRYEEAARLWEKALRIDPMDKRALGYLAKAQEQLARTQEILDD